MLIGIFLKNVFTSISRQADSFFWVYICENDENPDSISNLVASPFLISMPFLIHNRKYQYIVYIIILYCIFYYFI